jgi:hypothetical protein
MSEVVIATRNAIATLVPMKKATAAYSRDSAR